MLLPLAVLLNGIGYVFIARLDEDLAALQATWTAVGIGAFVVTLRRRAPRPRPRALPLHVRPRRHRACCCMPLLPGIGRNINGARIWVSIGPLSFQPGEFAKIALALFFAAYLVEKRELLSHGDVASRPVPSARAPAPRPRRSWRGRCRSS